MTSTYLPPFSPSEFPGEVTDRFDPARLTQARLAAGFSKARLADLIGVTAGAVGKYEARVIMPREALIPALADALGVPADFFTPGRPIGHVDVTEAHFRSLRSTALWDRARAVAFIEQVWELTVVLEKHVHLPEVNLPSAGAVGQDPVATAHHLRERWGLGAEPIKNLTAVVESHGIVVALLTPANADVARVGAFSTSHLPRPVIVVTPELAASVHVHRFTLAHELGHILLHHEAAPGDPQQEREADRFAAEFLTPREQIVNWLPRRLNMMRLEETSRRWGVSVDSLLIRMKETGTASDASVRHGRQKLKQLRSEGLEMTEPTSAHPGETPTILNDAAALAESNGYAVVDLARELKWKVARVREVLGAEDAWPASRILPTVQ